MSSIINKVKDALHSDKDKTTHDNTHTNTHDHTKAHNTRSSAADPRVDPALDNRAGHNTTATGHGGAYTSNDSYALGGDNRGTDGPATKTDGPHSSNLANKIDPRVDSDRDGSTNLGANPHGTATTGNTTHSNTGFGQTHTGTHNLNPAVGTVGGAGVGHTAGHNNSSAYGTQGPHSSNLANKVDPRVDSDPTDISQRHNLGAGPGAVDATFGNPNSGVTGYPNTSATHGTAHGNTGTGGAFFSGGNDNNHGLAGSNATGPASTTAGPHSSNLANKADPRVDSDLDSSRQTGAYGTTGTQGIAGNQGFSSTHGTTGTHGIAGNQGISGTHGTTGTHGIAGNQGIAGTHGNTGNFNQSQTGTTHGTHQGSHIGGTHAPGPAANTAGPHKNDLLNKLDPRVDSNLDGSKTVGGDKTYQSTTTTTHRDPSDASQVPPSVLQKHIGSPTVHHDDATHDRERRHSVSHQEQHRGL